MKKGLGVHRAAAWNSLSQVNQQEFAKQTITRIKAYTNPDFHGQDQQYSLRFRCTGHQRWALNKAPFVWQHLIDIRQLELRELRQIRQLRSTTAEAILLADRRGGGCGYVTTDDEALIHAIPNLIKDFNHSNTDIRNFYRYECELYRLLAGIGTSDSKNTFMGWDTGCIKLQQLEALPIGPDLALAIRASFSFNILVKVVDDALVAVVSHKGSMITSRKPIEIADIVRSKIREIYKSQYDMCKMQPLACPLEALGR